MMERRVESRMVLESDGPVEVVAAVSVARGHHVASETLRATREGERMRLRELEDAAGGRLHVLESPGGRVELEYAAVVDGLAPAPAVGPLDAIVHARPSRYCESDALGELARAEFAGLGPVGLLDAVPDWVHARLAYDGGATSPTGGALETIERRAGVCRDFAHVTIALLRALDVPARLAAVYAPGLSPMDFHAVAEVLVDGAWHVVDATRLAPRETLVRIATGRDASDTAFLTTAGAGIRLLELEVDAHVSGEDRGDDLGADGRVELR